MQISAKLVGDRKFRAKMGQIQKRIGDTQPFMKALAIQVHGWILRNYRSAGGLLKGRAWAPLAKSTIAGRRRGSSKPLQDTGHMMRQWNWRATRKKAEIGNPMDIAEFHERGTGIYGPERRRYVIEPKAKKALAFITGGYTVGKYGKAKARSKTDMAVVKRVIHPGIRQRRQLPTEAEILPDLLAVGDVWLKKATR